MNIDLLVVILRLNNLDVSPVHGVQFMCTFVYGSTNKHERQQLFHDLRVMSQSVSSPWIVLGDFNCVVNLDKRIGSPVRLAEVQPLRDSSQF